ncbi:uncharacterized protein LOC126662207 isoform X2 [Mercurialis annua]|uniref:uncharacterized protein LOC126662207 isoform X2 n=1 Tax=Mercurialis annua TaxID=3986 RepID=UPI0021600655|nr:uncharacterized protein LOC126662207 isoform X2 [Mercurialis annua]XP_050212067.1 uncharacterized protein LOC126662207 isoform X2 [Mercurialis annua]
MAWRSTGSLSRTFISAARAPSRISSAPLPRVHPSPAAASSRFQSRRVSFGPSRNLGEIGCLQSFMPLYSTVGTNNLTSRLNANLRAFCELSHGNGKDG